MKNVFISSVLIVVLLGNVTLAAHVDVRAYVQNGAIAVGSSELVGSTVVPLSDRERVFGAEFGEDDPAQPFMTEDPGFLSEDGAFPGGSGHWLGFNALSGLAFWNGSGFAGVPAFESLQITVGSQSVNVANDPAGGFNFAQIGAGGGLHQHMTFELLGSDGNPIPGDGVEPSPGIYLLELELTTTMSDVVSSAPIWIVFNNGDSEANHEAAAAWVENNLVPEPLSALLLVAGALPCRRRRGR
ncbi:MAG TPA: hypothetical protein PLL20_06850 [Phycisphaerae bacterium]|nr:hypothetical protein [Phycisphaerae bacterium]HRR84115.1 hypothetical protein [Phycisphaerae bacterium]